MHVDLWTAILLLKKIESSEISNEIKNEYRWVVFRLQIF